MDALEMSTDLSSGLHTHSLTYSSHKYGWQVRGSEKISRAKWQTAVSDMITVLIIQRFPTFAYSFPSFPVCFKQAAEDIFQGEGSTAHTMRYNTPIFPFIPLCWSFTLRGYISDPKGDAKVHCLFKESD